MLKRGSGVRHLPIFSNINSRAARVELLKKTRNTNNSIHNNNIMTIDVSENNYASNVVTATPSPVPVAHHSMVRAASPALAARSVRHIPGAVKHTINVQNTEKPLRPSLIGKQVMQTLKTSRRNRRRRQTRRRR